jgi:hypothetical protein
VDANAAVATHVDGVLQLTLPRSPRPTQQSPSSKRDGPKARGSWLASFFAPTVRRRTQLSRVSDTHARKPRDQDRCEQRADQLFHDAQRARLARHGTMSPKPVLVRTEAEIQQVQRSGETAARRSKRAWIEASDERVDEHPQHSKAKVRRSPKSLSGS